MRLPDMISIESGPLLARFRPDWGGRMTHLVHAEMGDILAPTQADVFEPYNWPRAGAYPLVPYHNRVYGASFVESGKTHRLLPHPALTPDAMHGPAHRRPWHVASAAEDRVTLQLNYEADDEWPFSFLAEQHFRLEPDRLIVELSIINSSDVSAPLSLGWHPYLAVPLSSHAETDARLEYPLDALNVPTGSEAHPRSSRSIPAATGYTLHFRNWSTAMVELDKATLLLEADPVFEYLAVHRMEKYLCLEPVAMAAGALCLPETERESRGLRTIPPEGRLSGCIFLSIRG